MKVWLNDLKEGDIFYWPCTILNNALKCEHLGDAHNMNYKMSRIKFKVLEGCDNDLIDLLSDTNELFVNQYVYTDYESAHEECINKLKNELKSIKESIVSHKAAIVNLETREQNIENKINEYDKHNTEKNIGEPKSC